MKTEVRPQSADESDHEHYEIKTIGDISQVGNTDPIPVVGVGVVVGLDDTGGEAPMDDNRKTMEDWLRKKGIRNIQELMTSSKSALVLVSGYIPPGAHKGDVFDIEVKLPARTKATSLRGGYLKECDLRTFEHARNLSPRYTGGRGTIIGHILARAEGPVVAGLGEGEGACLKTGVVWGGARHLAEAPLAFLLTQGNQYGPTAMQVEKRINETFQGTAHDTGFQTVAAAQHKLGVFLRVPAPYRLNVTRFILVARLIPYSPAAGPAGDLPTYKRRLADDLLDPSRTVSAALRLEALGSGSIQVLKKGLESPEPLVRFCSAEALAYLGSPSSSDELARAVMQRPMLRAFALTALASLGESASRTRLKELVTSAADDETRYGAFRALRMLDDQDPLVQGELLGDSFWLHRVAPNTPPLVHFTSNHRCEIVFFGPEPCLLPDFSYLAGDYVLTSAAEDDKCTISRVNSHGEPTRKQCSLKLGEVLHVLADLGASYPEVVELIRQAHDTERLSCRVRCDALPQATKIVELADAGKSGASLEVPGGPAAADLGPTPSMFDLGKPQKKPSKPTADKPDLEMPAEKLPTFTRGSLDD